MVIKIPRQWKNTIEQNMCRSYRPQQVCRKESPNQAVK